MEHRYNQYTGQIVEKGVFFSHFIGVTASTAEIVKLWEELTPLDVNIESTEQAEKLAARLRYIKEYRGNSFMTIDLEKKDYRLSFSPDTECNIL